MNTPREIRFAIRDLNDHIENLRKENSSYYPADIEDAKQQRQLLVEKLITPSVIFNPQLSSGQSAYDTSGRDASLVSDGPKETEEDTIPPCPACYANRVRLEGGKLVCNYCGNGKPC